MSEQTQPRCITCKFCDVQNANEGICRLEPPKTALAMNAGHPAAMCIRVVVTPGLDWCSKYEVQLVKPVAGNVLTMPGGLK